MIRVATSLCPQRLKRLLRNIDSKRKRRQREIERERERGFGFD